MKRLAVFLTILVAFVAVNVVAETGLWSVTLHAGTGSTDAWYAVGGYSTKWAIHAYGDTVWFVFSKHRSLDTFVVTLLDGESFSTTSGPAVDSVRIVRPNVNVEASARGTKFRSNI